MSNWSTQDLPDLSGQLALVTGGNSGIGYWTSLHLARAGAQVVLACRSMPRAEAAMAELQAAVPQGRFEILPLDLADLSSVHRAADQLRSRHPRLDILCNNAGIALAPMQRTRDGFESQFGSNYLGHFALTGLLLDLLRASAACRVVHVGSLAHRIGRIDFEDPNYQQRRYSAWGAYGQSKLANVLFMLELERRFRREGGRHVSVGAHPGMSGTNIGASLRIVNLPVFRSWNQWLQRAALNQPEQAAEPTLLAATQPGIAGGGYFGPRGWMEIKGSPAPAQLSAAARDPAAAERLWQLAESLTGVRYL